MAEITVSVKLALYSVSLQVPDQIAFTPESFLTSRTYPGFDSRDRRNIAGVVVQSPVSGEQAGLSEGLAAVRHGAVEGFETCVDQVVTVQLFLD